MNSYASIDLFQVWIKLSTGYIWHVQDVSIKQMLVS